MTQHQLWQDVANEDIDRDVINNQQTTINQIDAFKQYEESIKQEGY